MRNSLTVHFARSLPGLTPDNTAYWTGGARGQLLISRCAACRNYVHPPGPVCPACWSRRVDPEAVSGYGRLVTYTVNHHAWWPGQKVPYVFAVTELDEQRGLVLCTNLLNCAVERIRIGMRVRVCFEQEGEVWVPQFEAVE